MLPSSFPGDRAGSVEIWMRHPCLLKSARNPAIFKTIARQHRNMRPSCRDGCFLWGAQPDLWGRTACITCGGHALLNKEEPCRISPKKPWMPVKSS